MNFAPWQRATENSGGPTNGARALLAWMQREYPQGRSMGIYNYRPVRGAQALSIHSEGRALDWGMPMVNGKGSPEGHAIVKRLAEHGHRLGIQGIIYDRRIWSASSPRGRAYLGTAPHYDHLHIELTRSAGERLNLATLDAVLGTSGAAPTAPTAGRPVLRSGSAGPDVRTLQERLVAHGYQLGATDGRFGPRTEMAVRAFQQDRQLAVDGVVGPQTWSRLDVEPVPPAAPVAPATPVVPAAQAPEWQAPPSCAREVLRMRSRGRCVQTLQRRLNTLGFQAGAPDGIFGKKTNDAVVAFQKDRGLIIDGVVGPQTWSAL